MRMTNLRGAGLPFTDDIPNSNTKSMPVTRSWSETWLIVFVRRSYNHREDGTRLPCRLFCLRPDSLVTTWMIRPYYRPMSALRHQIICDQRIHKMGTLDSEMMFTSRCCATKLHRSNMLPDILDNPSWLSLHELEAWSLTDSSSIRQSNPFFSLLVD